MSNTKLIGILNLTPDSFSDGGKYNAIETALNQTQKLIDDGASVIDIGAESTRPNATPINAAEEWLRLEKILPEIIRLCHQNKILSSLDTRHAASAKKAIALDIDWINDVSGFESAAMIDAVKDSNVSLVFMHNLGVPADKNKTLPADADVIETLLHWAKNKITQLTNAGIAQNRLIFDAGIGFGKNAEQSWQIINNIAKLKTLPVPILIGHSRKSFLGDVDKDAATIKASITMAKQGVDYLRVHDVKGHIENLASLR
jgi:dihydropteroate synthase